MRERTQVAIVGAGPAGLTLAHLLAQEGIESVVLELRSRDYVEHRLRAGHLDRNTIDVLTRVGAGERMNREGLVQRGCHVQFAGERHRIALDELTDGRCPIIYGQTEVVKDLIRLRLERDEPLLFEVDDVTLEGLTTDSPTVHYIHEGVRRELRCDVVAGCDGFHGVSRRSIPDGVLTEYSRVYPFAWLGILAQVAPSSRELVYSAHERGFALLSMRSPEISRLYLQCSPHEDADAWSDDRLWAELQTRFNLDGWTLEEGPIVAKSVTDMRSFMVEPMQYGRLLLAGDAAHIVPPSAAKGLNLAIADATVLAAAVSAWARTGDEAQLAGYSERCLPHVWRGQQFSEWMTTTFHQPSPPDPFAIGLQREQLRYLLTSYAALSMFVENYVGLAIGTPMAAAAFPSSP